ncbi:MAG: hypothetical protein ACJAUB_002208, partial [Cryomorphaceae bacterium]
MKIKSFLISGNSFFIGTLLIAGILLTATSCDDDDDDADDCVQTTWYEDADTDGLGNPDSSQSACTQPAGYVANNTD